LILCGGFIGAIGFVVSALKKNNITFVAALAGIFFTAASFLRKMPLAGRLLLYMDVLIIIYVIAGLANILQVGKQALFSKLVPVIIVCLLIAIMRFQRTVLYNSLMRILDPKIK
jgi:hypothetical protein